MESRRLRLSVANAEALEYGCRASHAFDSAGGTIGGRDASWPLSDRDGRVAPLHAEIVAFDGTFCLIDRSGLTRINGALEPLGTDRIVRLADGDTVQVGPYRLNVYIGDSGDAAAVDLDDRSLDAILAAPGPLDDGEVWLNSQSGYRVLSAPTASDDEPIDPLLALDATAMRGREGDPFDATHYGLSARQESPPDRADTMVEAFRDRHFLAAPAEHEITVAHVDIAPSDPSGMPERALRKNCHGARDSLRHTLLARTDALSRHHEALLLAVDEALNSILTICNDAEVPGINAVPQQDGGKRDGVVTTFWQSCENAYRRRMEQQDA